MATLATMTGALNIVSMSLTVAETARLAAGAAVLDIPWTRAIATLLIVVPAAFLFGSVMVAIGAMARSFKEAQTLLMPVYLMCLDTFAGHQRRRFPAGGRHPRRTGDEPDLAGARSDARHRASAAGHRRARLHPRVRRGGARVRGAPLRLRAPAHVLRRRARHAARLAPPPRRPLARPRHEPQRRADAQRRHRPPPRVLPDPTPPPPRRP